MNDVAYSACSVVQVGGGAALARYHGRLRSGRLLQSLPVGAGPHGIAAVATSAR